MGNDLSSSIVPPPLSVNDCIVNGELDFMRYYMYKRKLRRKLSQYTGLKEIGNHKRKRVATSLSEELNVRQRKRRTIKRRLLWIRDDDGNLRVMKPEDTLWFKLYIEPPILCTHMRKLFRKRFRLTYNSFMELLNEIIGHKLFLRWNNPDAAGSRPSSVALLLLGTLRCLGRAWTFDDVEEATAISREVIRVFFHKFLIYGSTVLYKKHVTIPATTTDSSIFESIFASAGFNGCIGSTDGTHIGMHSCASWAAHSNTGHKLSIPSRTYNVTVTHWRQILSTTCGHPSTWNDKTIVLFDDLVRGVNNGDKYFDNEFKLLEYDMNGNVQEVTYVGAWFMVDNGYLSWSCTVPPLKYGVTYKEIRFSEWLELMRKDVECTFGIMKGRFSILRYGTRLHSIKKCDQLFLTCCALHNRLLFIDGLHKNWLTGAESNWEKDNRDCKHNKSFAMRRLSRLTQGNEGNIRNVPHASLNMTSFKKYTVNGKRVICKMPLYKFQNRLIEHFDIRFKRNTIVWPQRMKTPTVI